MSTLFRRSRKGSPEKKQKKSSRKYNSPFNHPSSISIKSVPSLEETIPESIEQVLGDSAMRMKFRAFLDERVAVESLNFYEAIEDYEQLATEAERNTIGPQMVEEFVKEESRYSCNLNCGLRSYLEALENFSPLAFHGAKGAMLNLMHSNFFCDFKKKLADSSLKLNSPSLSLDNRLVYRSGSFEDLSESLIDPESFRLSLMVDLDEDESLPSASGRGKTQKTIRSRSSGRRTGRGLSSLRRSSRMLNFSRRSGRSSNRSKAEPVKSELGKSRSNAESIAWHEVVDLSSTL